MIRSMLWPTSSRDSAREVSGTARDTSFTGGEPILKVMSLRPELYATDLTELIREATIAVLASRRRPLATGELSAPIRRGGRRPKLQSITLAVTLAFPRS
jgi:hypothetical protein